MLTQKNAGPPPFAHLLERGHARVVDFLHVGAVHFLPVVRLEDIERAWV